MKILDFWYFDDFKTESPARTAKRSVQRRKKRPESGINATQKEAAGNPTDSYFTIKRKKYQVFIRAIFIFFRKIILIFRACRKAPRQVNPRLILGFPLRGSCPRSGLKRSIISYSRLPLGGLFSPSCRQRQSLRLSCPQSGLKRSIISALYQASPWGESCQRSWQMKGGYIIDS